VLPISLDVALPISHPISCLGLDEGDDAASPHVCRYLGLLASLPLASSVAAMGCHGQPVLLPSLGGVSMEDDHICYKSSAMAAPMLQVVGRLLPWALPLGDQRCYLGHPALLPSLTGSATLGGRRCYLGHPALLPSTIGVASLGGQRCYLGRPALLPTSDGFGTTGKQCCCRQQATLLPSMPNG
jgi:hypothetical protein